LQLRPAIAHSAGHDCRNIVFYTCLMQTTCACDTMYGM